MTPKFIKAFLELKGHEGGYKAEKKDRMDWTGGRVGVGELRGTKFGISAGTYPHLDIKNLTIEQAQAIYYKDWWLASRVEALPYELAYQVFDAEVNHGRKTGIKFLQDALGFTGRDVDGILGKNTLSKVREMSEDKIIMRMLGVRLRFFTNIGTWDTYGRGWARRVANLLIAATED